MEMKDEIKDLKELKEAQTSHNFLTVRIFDILYILITLNSNHVILGHSKKYRKVNNKPVDLPYKRRDARSGGSIFRKEPLRVL